MVEDGRPPVSKAGKGQAGHGRKKAAPKAEIIEPPSSLRRKVRLGAVPAGEKPTSAPVGSSGDVQIIQPPRPLHHKVRRKGRRSQPPEPSRPEIIEPPNPLRNKVRFGSGLSAEEAIARAQRVIERARHDFIDLIERETGELMRLFARYKRGDRDNIESIFRIAHNLRGLGTTFGYDLLTRLGTSMCRYITERRAGEELEIAILEAHVQALRAVVRQHILGEGDRTSQEVARILDDLVRGVTVHDEETGQRLAQTLRE